MGRYEVGSFGSLPGMGITIISAVLSILGQYCVRSIPLNMYNRAIKHFLGNSLSIFGVTKSGPGEFLLLSVSIPFELLEELVCLDFYFYWVLNPIAD
jgi:hypothetical protein